MWINFSMSYYIAMHNSSRITYRQADPIPICCHPYFFYQVICIIG
ncbi:unnamed protein product [Linum tenue]|uniref:Uncharacterized protein n=1 Tax=Linum tenue TaxID=586396 RepID=A0AAV0NRS1_9ROSI|nr:unnamed protein product [Linum tenue]